MSPRVALPQRPRLQLLLTDNGRCPRMLNWGACRASRLGDRPRHVLGIALLGQDGDGVGRSCPLTMR